MCLVSLTHDQQTHPPLFQMRRFAELKREIGYVSPVDSIKPIHRLLDQQNAGHITTAFIDREMSAMTEAVSAQVTQFFRIFPHSHSNSQSSQSIETSSTTISLAILMLAMHPDAQERVHAEISAMAHDPMTDFTYDDITVLPTIEAVLKETLRLFPVVPIIGRQTTEKTKLQNGVLPAGTTCIIPLWKLHRFQHIWGDDCNDFVPDRFLGERSKQFDAFYFMPFSYGSRGCIGNKYAMLSLKIMLLHLIGKFEFRTDMRFDDLDFFLGNAIKLKNKYEVNARRRK